MKKIYSLLIAMFICCLTYAQTAAVFPSRLRTSGRVLVDENNHVMSKLKGFCAQVVPWSQTDFNSMAAVGGKIVRQIIFWDSFEPTQGNISASMIASLDTQIANTQAAGMYSFFSFHLNVGRDPTWTNSISNEVDKVNAYGKTLIQYLANRYGNPSSPQYTKSVMGLGLNEPPPLDSNNPNPHLEAVQSTLIGWFRASAPNWIGFVTYGYASSTPIYNRSWQSATAANASTTAYNSVGGNVILDFHDYLWGVTGSPANGVPASDPTAEVRWPNGLPNNGCFVGLSATYANNATIRSQQMLFIAPYKQFSINANIPLMIGEWGWVPTATGENAWITDAEARYTDAGTVIELQWDYDVTPGNDQWAAYPNHVWRTSTTTWMGITSVGIGSITSSSLKIYPNPFNTNFTLKIPSEIVLKNAMIKIYDVCGKEVKTVLINSNETIIDRGELQSGLYFYTIINNNEKIANGKIVVQ